MIDRIGNNVPEPSMEPTVGETKAAFGSSGKKMENSNSAMGNFVENILVEDEIASSQTNVTNN